MFKSSRQAGKQISTHQIKPKTCYNHLIFLILKLFFEVQPKRYKMDTYHINDLLQGDPKSKNQWLGFIHDRPEFAVDESFILHNL